LLKPREVTSKKAEGLLSFGGWGVDLTIIIKDGYIVDDNEKK